LAVFAVWWCAPQSGASFADAEKNLLLWGRAVALLMWSAVMLRLLNLMFF
jgi:hypothetical protein